MALKNYLMESDMVYQTTIDPKGPGVVRLHLVPPKKIKDGIPWIVVINGFRILPILTSYAVLLKEFIITYNPCLIAQLTIVLTLFIHSGSIV